MTNNINKYNQEYKKKNYKRITLLIPKNNEEVIEELEKQPAINAYIISLIKEDIENKKIIEKIKNEKK